MIPKRVYSMRGLNDGTGTYQRILLSTSRSISRDASSPDSILPICSGGIDATKIPGDHRRGNGAGSVGLPAPILSGGALRRRNQCTVRRVIGPSSRPPPPRCAVPLAPPTAKQGDRRSPSSRKRVYRQDRFETALVF
jgi:hypothetical protein